MMPQEAIFFFPWIPNQQVSPIPEILEKQRTIGTTTTMIEEIPQSVFVFSKGDVS